MEDNYLDLFPHKKFGYCRKCGKPIWATVLNGSGSINANGKCWECATKDNDYDIMHFDYCKTDPKEQEEYLEYIKQEHEKEEGKVSDR